MAGPKKRDRYVAVELPEPRAAREFSAVLHAATADWPREGRPQLLFIEGRRGLVRCGHLQKDAVVRMLNGLRLAGDAPVRTVGTSGTIRRARMRYFSQR